jgi:hypothetical protein
MWRKGMENIKKEDGKEDLQKGRKIREREREV